MIEVIKDGKVIISADSKEEAISAIERYVANKLTLNDVKAVAIANGFDDVKEVVVVVKDE